VANRAILSASVAVATRRKTAAEIAQECLAQLLKLVAEIEKLKGRMTVLEARVTVRPPKR
jgi:hypothetical protein